MSTIKGSFDVLGVSGSSCDQYGIARWERDTDLTCGTCAIKGCSAAGTIAGHMHIKHKQQHYVTPICACHNSAAFDWDRDATDWVQTKASAVIEVRTPHPDTFDYHK